ncbi:MAG: vitamin K epoxide reductase family protein [Deltaproteobacteria bacterium]|nr:vitamin K epoxide reductase family protein [Deltaproteobacteria bacterium]
MGTPLSFSDDRTDRSPDKHVYSDERKPPPGSAGNASTVVLFLVAIAALLGLIFAGVSTSDFIEHLDRQVHSIHCSFIPGAAKELGDNGCKAVMMSVYSSVLRTSLWGGIPVALGAVGVFAFLIMKSLQLALAKTLTRNETLFLVVAWALPVLMSVIFGSIAVTKIGEVCKLCVGIYVSSALGFGLSIFAHAKASSSSEPMPLGLYARWFGEGVVYVSVLVIFYMLFAPQAPKSLEGCGTLVHKEDTAGIFIPMSRGTGTSAIAVVDPLCPACKGFDERLMSSGLTDQLAMNAVLFPLDSSCNWMVKESMHPGACAVSEAMLCAKAESPDAALDILDWAFANQERLRASAKESDAPVRSEILEKFPKVKGCLGSSNIKNKVNKSLRWAVQNALPVLTPQLFIGDKRVCDEDTDLGLEYTVTRLLEGSAAPESSRRKR